MESVRAIGFAGYAGAGKTTAASYVESRYGYRRRHIATPLRAMLEPLLKAAGVSESMVYRYLEGDLKEAVIPELGVTSRHLQITLGTEWGRTHVSPDLWAKLWSLGAEGLVMNDSVRFTNEERSVRELGGVIVRIDRPGVGPAKFKHRFGAWLYRTFGIRWGIHPSERVDLITPDYVITNDHDEADLFAELDGLMDELRAPQGARLAA